MPLVKFRQLSRLKSHWLHNGLHLHNRQCCGWWYLTNSLRITNSHWISQTLHSASQAHWLSSLPAKSRSYHLAYGGPIAERMCRTSCSKQAITDRSRKIHFLKWCKGIGLDDLCTPHIAIQARNWIIACYAVSLRRGETRQGVRIRHSTMMSYIKQALQLHEHRHLPNLK